VAIGRSMYPDIFLIGVMRISGLLALLRGFMREILSILAWVPAAVAQIDLVALLLASSAQSFGGATDCLRSALPLGGRDLRRIAPRPAHQRDDLHGAPDGHDPRQPHRRPRPQPRVHVRPRPRPDHRGGGVRVLQLAGAAEIPARGDQERALARRAAEHRRLAREPFAGEPRYLHNQHPQEEAKRRRAGRAPARPARTTVDAGATLVMTG